MLRGAIAAALTPLAGAGAVPDEGAFGPYTAFLASYGIDGILALGTTGEGVLFDVAERKRIAELFIEHRGALQVAVHCGAQSTADTVELAEHAAAAGADAVAVIAPPYFAFDGQELLEHFSEAARACDPVPFYVYEFAARSGYAVPLPTIAALRDEAPNFVGLKVSDTPWERFSPYLVEGLDIFVGPESLIPEGVRGRRDGRGVRSRGELPGRGRRARPRAHAGERRTGRRASCFPAGASLPRGVEDGARPPRRRGARWSAAATPRADRRRARRGRAHRARMGRIVVAGSGAIGASIAYQLALLGADDVVVAERGELVGGSTSRAMGGVRQQFSTAGRGGARAREHRVPRVARLAALPPGRLSLPRDDRRRLRRARGTASPTERPRRAGRARRPGSRARSRGRRRRSARPAAGATAWPTRPVWRGRCCGGRRSAAWTSASTRRPKISTATRSSSRAARGRLRSPHGTASSCRSARSAGSCSRRLRSRACPTTCRW